MEDETKQTEYQHTTPHFQRLIGKRIFVQLRVEWIGVTWPTAPVVQPAQIQTVEGPKANPKAGQVVAIPFLHGKLLSEDKDSILIDTEDPNPGNRGCFCEIRIDKRDVLHVTYIRREDT